MDALALQRVFFAISIGFSDRISCGPSIDAGSPAEREKALPLQGRYRSLYAEQTKVVLPLAAGRVDGRL